MIKSVTMILIAASLSLPIAVSANIDVAKFLLLGSVSSVVGNTATVRVTAASKSAASLKGTSVKIPLQTVRVTQGVKNVKLTPGQQVKVRGIVNVNTKTNNTTITKTRWIQVARPAVKPSIKPSTQTNRPVGR